MISETALRGRARENGLITLKHISPVLAASTCAVCGGAHETPPLLRFMRGMAEFITAWRAELAS